MDPFTVKIPEDHLDEARVTLLDMDDTFARRPKGKHEVFRIAYSGGVIIGYKTGSIVANTHGAAGLLRKVLRGMDFPDETKIVIGSDEVGKGEWLGPLVVCAVALSPENTRELRAAGVQDSKELTPHQIGSIAYDIEKNSLAIESVLIPPDTFEKRLSEMRKEGKNLNDLLAWAHAKAVSQAYEEIGSLREDSGIKIVIDEFAAKKTRLRLEREIDLDAIELVQKPAAEDVIAVAAASIMARDLRDEWLDRLSQELGFELVGITIEEAKKRKNLKRFAKLSYLKGL